ncbi:MAG: substrate-binding periplasmic protein [Cellvibrionaceae bacterium]
MALKHKCRRFSPILGAICKLLISLSVMGVSANSLPPLVLGVEDSWPPYSDKRGNGISKEIIVAALGAVGQPVSFVVLPYARVLRDVESGFIDGGFNVTRQASTSERFIFGEVAILKARGSFFYPPDSPLEISNHADIKDSARIGLILGYEYGNAYEQHRHRFREFKVGQQSQIVRMLMARRLDLAIMFDEVAKQTLMDMGLASDSITQGAENHLSEIYVVFSRRNPLSGQYAEKLDQGLNIIKASGQYADIIH